MKFSELSPFGSTRACPKCGETPMSRVWSRADDEDEMNRTMLEYLQVNCHCGWYTFERTKDQEGRGQK